MRRNLDTYRQMLAMGPRRSGRSVANVKAASIVALQFGKATVVATNRPHADQLTRDVHTFGYGPSVDVVTLGEVHQRHLRGPFFPDHHTVDTIVSSFTREIERLEREVQRRNAYIQQLTGDFRDA